MMKPGWKTARLKDVSTVVGGSTPKTDIPEYWGGDNYWVAPAELDGSKFISSTVKRITNLAISKTNLTLLPQGTVLLSSRAPIGKVAITTVPMYCNQGFKNIVCGPELFNGYVYYFLKHNVDYLQSLGTGATFKEISKKVVENVSISYPSLAEQQRIVDELDLLTSIIDKKNAQLRDLDALAQSIFYEMFGDSITNDKGWPKKMLKELGEVITGNTPSTKDARNYATEDVCFFKPSDIGKEGVTALHKSEFHISTYAFENSRKLPIGSILTTCIGIVGKVGILTKEATCNQQINAIIPEKVDSLYLAYAILSQKDLLEKMANAPVVPIINKGNFSKIKITIPPIDLQHAFAAKIEAIEQQKALIKQSLQETQTLLASRMDHYFSD